MAGDKKAPLQSRSQAARRQFFRKMGHGLLATGALIPALHASRVSGSAPEPDCDLDVVLPGRLGNPDLTLLTDPRLNERVRTALSTPSPPGVTPVMPPQVTLESSYEESLAWVAAMEKMLEAQGTAALAMMPKFSDVVSSEETIVGVDGNKIRLFIDRPKTDGPKKRGRKLPCVVHIHGGGMSFSSAEDPSFVRWRKTLAQRGMVVVGVEFRNAGGKLGVHPFPAGLNDCASGVRWAYDNRSKLNVSSIVVAGESGGGNLAVATGIKANIEGWVKEIDGVFAMAPMILGFYSSAPPELLAWRENLGYQGTREMMRAMTRVYDPKDMHEHDPMAWPFHATAKELKGLPPHIITNYELDLIRDDGAVFAQKLTKSGVSAISRTITGAPHVPEIATPDLIPELTRDTVASLVEFAESLGR
ncbi:MAG TPA: alpha/beta hydrolase [Gammaproteobacteria bacterium]|nr:alpha/beta hydrolase [Gammaproteobacteria bacterium]